MTPPPAIRHDPATDASSSDGAASSAESIPARRTTRPPSSSRRSSPPRFAEILLLSVALLAALASLAPAAAATLRLTPIADASLYEETTTSTANGSGEFLLAGRTNQAAFSRRRSLLRFDLSALPQGTSITAVSLHLHLTTVSTATTTLSLHRVTSPWSEGPANPAGNESAGLPATTGDVTWLSSHHPETTWSSPGGDFLPTASASATVGTTEGIVSWSDARLIDDLAAWTTHPAANFGWLLRDPESSPQTAKRFASSDHPDPAMHPILTIEFTPVPEPATASLLAVAGSLLLRRHRHHPGSPPAGK